MGTGATIVWFRQDLRLRDHVALARGVDRGGAVVPVFCWWPEGEGRWAAGAASRWWLHRSLAALQAELGARGSRLVIRRGDPAVVLPQLAQEVGAGVVAASRRYEPAARTQEECVGEALAAVGASLEVHAGALLHEPARVRAGTGLPYRVFTPFWKTVLPQVMLAPELPAPAALRPPGAWPTSLALDELGLKPTVGWDEGLDRAWEPGERGALRRLSAFVEGSLGGYCERRDVPAVEGTSGLSPHLHFGEVGPAQVLRALRTAGAVHDAASVSKFTAEIGWREFAAHVLANLPRTAESPLRHEFERFPWRTDGVGLRAWQQGRTGYPLVDAGMRQLWHTGWMHNRVRMVAASFLVKHLLVSWREGADWFWDTLVDADLANNTMGWQWAGGCGADAAPYFRIFNPVLQSRKFDPQAVYIRRWVPELSRMGDEAIHAPWEAEPLELRAAGVELGRTYPHPIVDHAASRARALAAFGSVLGTVPATGGGGSTPDA
jgi:deoxyribodipyrimidine photo-lyase